MNSIVLNGLSKTYENFKLGPLNLTIPKGCIVGFIGENGAGKSTTIKAMLGLIDYEGEIKLLNEKPNAIKEEIGFVFDDITLPENFNLKKIKRFSKLAYKNFNETTFDKYVETFQLPNKKIKEFSRGMKMKLSLAVALSHDAKLLILDEATSGLDPVIRDELLEILLDYIQDENHTVFMSSHILSDLEKACDYIAFIHQGQLLFFEQKDDLKEQYVLAQINQDTFTLLEDKLIGYRQHAFGYDVLLKHKDLPLGIDYQKPSIEDIMVYIIRSQK